MRTHAGSLVLFALLTVASGDASAQVTVVRNGNGAVTSVPPGINCGGAVAATCHHTWPAGTHLRLHASPATNFDFAGWAGPCGGTSDCQFTVGANAVTVTANFSRKVRVKVSITGAGGVVGPGIFCNSGAGDCAENFTAGTAVTLNAAAQPGGNAFVSWSGVSCAAGPTSPVCAFTANSPITAVAKFRLPTLRVTIGGDGVGFVSYPSPVYGASALTCTNGARPRQCHVETYAPGTTVRVAARGDGDVNWSGAPGCPVPAPTASCVVTMSAPVNLGVTFVRPPLTLTIVTSGTLSASPVVNVATGASFFRSCTSTCTFGLPIGRTMTLRSGLATAQATVRFTGGCTSISGGNCTVVPSSNTPVAITATFSAPAPPPP